ncbi:MAG: hypothetical protein A2X13_14270 [Bacteroidetes bacterium GWC2_33_15]|nr:MAG: hypothetical protein A2X10_12315 [Bacteroidetes bacterium GWA2_33_15]OFX50041.1 MAG: hypothetical protein A2X13_14270 [Bacteroidetes bacterium GWC2_33_15]OFX65194.1 MAG: hypothetical protein A2X15_03845 [Bacteroidetes bacterium GWB2_32_14]OFX70420.1 MAG: hypothetical protein A2X14_03900 [Bacteroidetes bacterium GWD2_33_33]HAN19712.1 hypothetical protein [Bacteroidales bacterium]
MKSIQFIFRILLFLLIFIHTQFTYAQLNPPVFKEASVIPGTGNVLLKWELDQEAIDSAAIVYIYRDSVELQGINLIDTISNTSTLSYIDKNANANSRTRLYILRAVIKEDILNASDSKKFPTILLNFIYDSCKAEVNLNWSYTIANYDILPNVNFMNYEIYVSENGGSFQYIDQTTEKNYTVSDIEENTSYQFYIAAIADHAPDSKSASNTISFNADIAETPDYINTLLASVNGENIELQFDVDPLSELTTYKLLRAENLSGPFDTIQTIHTSEHLIYITDSDVKPAKKIYYYKLASINNCGTPIMESDIINTVLLKVENSDFINMLEWNAFDENNSSTCYYRIYRIIENQDTLLLHTSTNEYSYTDNIEDLLATNSGSKICYSIDCRISGETNHSNSNIDCSTLEPRILIPSAITPNTGNENCCFKPVFSFNPDNYTLIIYNRWSNVIFETGNPDESWDGRYPNGQYVPSGSYIYYLKMKTENNQTIEKRGNITVIYP